MNRPDFIEEGGQTWETIERRLLAELKTAQTAVEKLGQDPVRTEGERGKIAMIRTILAMPEEIRKLSARPVQSSRMVSPS